MQSLQNICENLINLPLAFASTMPLRAVNIWGGYLTASLNTQTCCHAIAQRSFAYNNGRKGLASRSGSPARLVHIVWRLSWQDGLGDCPRLSSLSSCVAVKTRQSKGTGKQRNPSPTGSIWRILAIFCNDWDVLVSHCVYV